MPTGYATKSWLSSASEKHLPASRFPQLPPPGKRASPFLTIMQVGQFARG